MANEADAGDRRHEPAAGLGRQREALRPVAGERMRDRMALGGERDEENGGDEGREKDEERKRQGVRGVAREQPATSGPAARPPTLAIVPTISERRADAPGVEVGDVCRGGRHAGAQREAVRV